MATTTTQIMEYVKIFMATAIDEQWTPEKIQQTWQEKTEDIKNIVEEGLPKKIKKVSSPKDPMKPKRGRSAYIFFCGETREEVKKELGDVKPQQVMSQLGARWKELKESTQRKDKALIAKYTKMAEEDKKRAEEELSTYIPPTDEELLANKPKRGRPSSTKKSDKPKRARSNYIFFCGENRQKLKDEYPDEDGKWITKMLSEMWLDLKEDEDREDELQIYIDMSNEDKKRYEREMETYQPSDDEEPPKKKKVISPKEEEKPKKKVTVVKKVDDTGFKKFVKANRKDYKDENPDMKPAQITKLMKQEWEDLDVDEKQAWADEEQE